MRDLRVTKPEDEIKFKGAWNELETKNCFQRQSFTEYLSQTREMAKYGKVLISIFQQFFASINKTFSLDGGLGTML